MFSPGTVPGLSGVGCGAAPVDTKTGCGPQLLGSQFAVKSHLGLSGEESTCGGTWVYNFPHVMV